MATPDFLNRPLHWLLRVLSDIFTGNIAIDDIHTATQEVSNYVDLAETTAPSDPAANTLRLWAEDEGGFSVLHLDDENGLNLELGRDRFHIVRNNSGGTLSAGEAVYVTGSTGVFPTVDKAKADDNDTMPAWGIVIADISNNSFGRVLVAGDLQGQDTSSFSDGNVLYVSSSSAGVLTTTVPGSRVQKVGTVIKGGTASAGIISVGPEAVEPVVVRVVVADQTVNTSTTLTDVFPTGIAVAANDVFSGWVQLVWTSGATPDIKFGWSYPSGCQIDWHSHADFEAGNLTESSTRTVAAVGADRSSTYHFTVRNGSTAGTVDFQFAQATSDASDTTVYTGSTLFAVRAQTGS